jgi:hypothetical protein
MLYLEHFISNTRAGPNEAAKVLLIDSHISYISLKFVIYTTVMNVFPYAFLSHLTYIMQPLNISVF